MPLLRLGDDAVLDTTDGVGIVMDTRAGEYFRLNPTATLMLGVAQRCDTLDEAVRELAELIDAEPGVLRAGLAQLTDQLAAHHLLAPTDAPR
ncbi:PqqD family protein [Nocardia sp. NPDC004068]|uniref:PqqD family protein n=1 Tax=Nocardia sp. NPDC004068 TaxID=3364303 RepID=UPI00369C8852